jgi:gas vesicle protein
MKTSTKVILGVAVAAAAGAAIGMLLAPEKGKDLRLKIAEGYKDWLAEFSSILALGREIVTNVKTKEENESEAIDPDFNKLTEKS